MHLPSGSLPAEGLARSLRAGQLHVHIYETRQQLGNAASQLIASEIIRLIQNQNRGVVIFASAPSQRETLAGLAAKGETLIDNVSQIERGYEKFDEKLRKLGAQIEKI